jgi:hypothetical protein
VGPRASLEGCGYSLPLVGFDLLTFQHVASRYTDNAIPENILDHHKVLTSTRIPLNLCHAVSPNLTIAGNKKFIVELTNKQKHRGVVWSRSSIITTFVL